MTVGYSSQVDHEAIARLATSGSAPLLEENARSGYGMLPGYSRPIADLSARAPGRSRADNGPMDAVQI